MICCILSGYNGNVGVRPSRRGHDKVEKTVVREREERETVEPNILFQLPTQF